MSGCVLNYRFTDFEARTCGLEKAISSEHTLVVRHHNRLRPGWYQSNGLPVDGKWVTRTVHESQEWCTDCITASSLGKFFPFFILSLYLLPQVKDIAGGLNHRMSEFPHILRNI